MPQRIVEANDTRYTIAVDDPPALTRRLWGVVRARVVDELTSRPPLVPVRLESAHRAFVPRVADGGVVGLAARPADVFPKLADRAYDIRFTVRADRFMPRHEEASVPISPHFPVRTIDPATDPNAGDTVLTLVSVDGISPTETLLVGKAGNRERVQVQNVNAPARQVTVAPPLANDHGGGDPVIAEQFLPFDPSTVVLDLGEIALHRRPVLVTGRTFRGGGDITPAPGAAVALTGLWRHLVPAAVEPPAEPPNVVSLEPPLYFARGAGAGRLRRREMSPVPGEDKVVLHRVEAGASGLSISDRVNLNSGDVLMVDADPAVQEFLTVDAVTPAGTPDLPAVLTFIQPTAHSHRPGARVRRVVPQPGGPDRSLSQDALAGDTCLFLGGLGGLGGVQIVEIHGGGPPAEYHRLHLFTTVSDAEGLFRLPMLSRVAKLEIEATDGADTSGPVAFVPDYAGGENHLELELS